MQDPDKNQSRNHLLMNEEINKELTTFKTFEVPRSGHKTFSFIEVDTLVTDGTHRCTPQLSWHCDDVTGLTARQIKILKEINAQNIIILI